MDHSGHMGGMNSTANATASSGGMSMGGGCKISMLLNYNTVDACFISSDWKITSNGMFAGSCIGIFLLCIAIEAVRRAGREYDRKLIAQARARHAETSAVPELGTAGTTGKTGSDSDSNSNSHPNGGSSHFPSHLLVAPLYQPTFVQHILRSFIYGSTFTAAFFVMLLGMYYNVYVLVCIFLGHFVGYIAFGRDTLGKDGEACGATGRCC